MRSVTILSLLPLIRLASASPAEPPTKVLKQRDIISDASSALAAASSAADKVISSIASSFPSATAAVAGIIPGLATTPSIDDTKNQFNLTDDDIQKLPINVLNLPGYANYSANTWNLLVHGQAYRTPATSGPALEHAADGFVPGVDVNQLNASEKANALNLTAAMYSIPVTDLQLHFDLSVNGTNAYSFNFPVLTSDIGEFNKFISLDDTAVPYKDNVVQKLDVHVNNTETGNATAYFVPTTGLTIVSDIDDILRITKIWEPEIGLNNTFVHDFKPWMNMEDIYSYWAQKFTGVHFHYLTTLPEPATRSYEQFIYSNYPAGSFDTRPSNFTTLDQIFQIRDVLLHRVIESFPGRSFVLVGDVSNRDIMRDYPALAKEFAGRVCILLRNTTSTDPTLKFPYDTSGFQGLPNNTYTFFNVPDDIRNLDLDKMQCRNSSIQQNVTFSYQNLPIGAGSSIHASFTNVVYALGLIFFGSLFL